MMCVSFLVPFCCPCSLTSHSSADDESVHEELLFLSRVCVSVSMPLGVHTRTHVLSFFCFFFFSLFVVVTEAAAVAAAEG